MANDPMSREEWQDAVDAADFLLRIHAAVLYGLVTTDLGIDAERCDEILVGGVLRGIKPNGV